MSEAGKAIHVLFLPDYSRSNPYQSQLRAALENLGVRVSGARAPKRNPFGVVTSWWRSGRPNVVHLHWTHPYLGQQAGGRHRRWTAGRGLVFAAQLGLLRLLGIRIVWTLHNLGIHELPKDAPENVRIHRRLVRLSQAVIAHCDAAAQAAVTTYRLGRRDEKKLHVIPHGNYVGAYGARVTRAQARAELDLPADARVFLFVGGVRAYKGITELIAAFRGLPGPDLRLLIYGKPFNADERDAVVTAAEGDARVKLELDFVPEENMRLLLGAADAVALPFREILTSGSAILAMSYGRAVIAPSLGCLPETLDDEGAVLYDPSVDGALSRALSRALDADLDAMGEHNLQLATRLAWPGIAAATAELYRA